MVLCAAASFLLVFKQPLISGIVYALAVFVGFLAFLHPVENDSFLSAGQINEQVDQCWSVDGSPIPIYKDDEPQNVSRIECVQKKPAKESFLTMQEFMDQVEKCKLVGGSPKPIYKDDEPQNVSSIECARQKY